MNGGLTHQEMELRKLKARNLDEALAWMRGRIDSEKLQALERILRRDLK
jgi:hypothetical protein